QPEIKSNMVRIKEDERGLIISLAADAFFAPASAEIDIENARETLQKASALLSSLPERKFRIEGHTDSLPTDPTGPWPTNWELSTARATNVLHYLVDFGVDERQFQVAGFADTVPIASNDTPEGRAYNRRVDIVILSEGHL
ncbi:MAG TPA: OmpA family protein, partial [Spirochaetia bacterium]|nr:OmpA family protein [Spirochaetia bacterium]